jgi:hypothetical protein
VRASVAISAAQKMKMGLFKGFCRTYFAGIVRSSIGPFKSVAMLPAAALASSWPFETERVLMSSSSTPTDFVVSFCAAAGVEAITSIAGISVGRCRILEVMCVVVMWVFVLGISLFN